ncbi:ATP-binding protein [Actinomadura kijaniata]|nr:ATP-binding protein [Actinomadura namibiensis]
MQMTRWSRLFPGGPGSVGEARRLTRALLGDNLLAETAELVVSELATNAVEHTESGEVGGSFVLELNVAQDCVRVSVVDMGSRGRPRVADESADEFAQDGRGLHIVQHVSKAWGCEPVRMGLRVWAELAEAL